MKLTNEQKEIRNKKNVLNGLVMYNELSKRFEAGASRADILEGLGPALDTLTSDIKWTSMNGFYSVRGKEAVARDIVETFETLPGIQVEVADAIAVGDDVVVYFFISGERTHGFMGLPATHRPYRVSVGAFSSFNDAGKRTQTRFTWSPLELFHQMGFARVAILGHPGETTTPCIPRPRSLGEEARGPLGARGSGPWDGPTPGQPNPGLSGTEGESWMDLVLKLACLPLEIMAQGVRAVSNGLGGDEAWPKEGRCCSEGQEASHRSPAGWRE